jgi:hypothetical protein
MGIITLGSGFGSQVTGQLMGGLPAFGELLGSISLPAPMVLGGVPFPMGQPLEIVSLPAGFQLPSAGPVTLPIGTMVLVPGRPELGTIAIETPISTEIMGSPGLGALGPTGVESVAGVQVPGPTTESVFQPGGIQLQLRQIPSTGGPGAPIAAVGLSLLAGAGLALRRLSKR